MKGISPKFPLMFDNTYGAYRLTKTHQEAITQNLKNLILTGPGERVMDIHFGVGLRRYFFEPMTQNVSSEIAQRLKKQVAKYMPFVIINTIDFNMNENSQQAANLLSMEVNFTISPLNEITLLTIDAST